MAISRRLREAVSLLTRSGFHYYRLSMLRPPFWVSVNGTVRRIAAGPDEGSRNCYREIVVADCCGLFEYAQQNRPKVIVDIGANVGMFSALCSMLFPDADIYAYEPNVDALRWLGMNARGTRIHVSSCAVSGSTGTARFDPYHDSTLGRLSPDGELIVSTLASPDVAAGLEIDLLKIDCEGAEWLILEEGSLLRRSKAVRLEYHLGPGNDVARMRAAIARAGHRIVSLEEDGIQPSGVVFTARVDVAPDAA